MAAECNTGRSGDILCTRQKVVWNHIQSTELEENFHLMSCSTSFHPFFRLAIIPEHLPHVSNSCDTALLSSHGLAQGSL